MIRNAKEVIVVADASKFNRIAFAAVVPPEAIHYLKERWCLWYNFHKVVSPIAIKLLFYEIGGCR